MFRPLFKGFLKLGQKYKNIFVGFLVQMKALKFAFEINWPLVLVALLQKSKIIYVTSAASVIQWGQIIFGSNTNSIIIYKVHRNSFFLSIKQTRHINWMKSYYWPLNQSNKHQWHFQKLLRRIVFCCYNCLDLPWEKFFQVWVTFFPISWEQEYCVEKRFCKFEALGREIDSGAPYWVRPARPRSYLDFEK